MIWLVFSGVWAARPVASAAPELRTLAEQSGWLRTGRYEEVERLCDAFQKTWPKQVRCFELGRSPEGRRMLGLVASADGLLEPAAARAAGRPVVLMQGGIHAGEIDGKDAGFLALRELLEGRAAKQVLSQLTLVFVPVFNVDGHERFGRWNRPNQVGPEQMGWRTTAQNLNLNRDYVKAEAPEMQAMLRLLNAWDPIVYADLHVTDGAQFQHDISINVAPTLAGDAELVRAGSALRDHLMRRLREQGSLPLDFYPAFAREDDPSSGVAVNVPSARFSQQYWAQRNRLGLLVETHSWKDYATRVHITRNTIIGLLEAAALHGKPWAAVAAAADQHAAQLAGSAVPLRYENTEHRVDIDFKGYVYTREPSAISGALVTRYDEKKPQVWRIPLADQVKPALSAHAPRGGYIVPAAHADWVLAKLALHGIEARRLNRLPALPVRVFRASKVNVRPATYEGRSVVSVEGAWAQESRDVPAGSLFVPIAQPHAVLAMTLFEPQGDDSLVSNGFFSSAFERKEYIEPYVAEQVAIELLKKDPALKREFTRKLESEPAFAQSPSARLDFFYQKHASWDEAFNLYPVYQVDKQP
ncbi:MAG: M14 family metallopeptidase [Polyangiales bacterium]